jgi:hypothetical protein
MSNKLIKALHKVVHGDRDEYEEPDRPYHPPEKFTDKDLDFTLKLSLKDFKNPDEFKAVHDANQIAIDNDPFEEDEWKKDFTLDVVEDGLSFKAEIIDPGYGSSIEIYNMKLGKSDILHMFKDKHKIERELMGDWRHAHGGNWPER